MDSAEILNEIKNQLEQLKHKGYDKNSFKSGYLLGYAKALQLLQTDVIKSVCDDCTAYPFDERGKTPLCNTCKDNPKQNVV
jgi:hypothetical protein